MRDVNWRSDSILDSSLKLTSVSSDLIGMLMSYFCFPDCRRLEFPVNFLAALKNRMPQGYSL